MVNIGDMHLEVTRLQGTLWVAEATIEMPSGSDGYIFTLTALTERGAEVKALSLLPYVMKRMDE